MWWSPWWRRPPGSCPEPAEGATVQDAVAVAGIPCGVAQPALSRLGCGRLASAAWAAVGARRRSRALQLAFEQGRGTEGLTSASSGRGGPPRPPLIGALTRDRGHCSPRARPGVLSAHGSRVWTDRYNRVQCWRLPCSCCHVRVGVARAARDYRNRPAAAARLVAASLARQPATPKPGSSEICARDSRILRGSCGGSYRSHGPLRPSRPGHSPLADHAGLRLARLWVQGDLAWAAAVAQAALALCPTRSPAS